MYGVTHRTFTFNIQPFPNKRAITVVFAPPYSKSILLKSQQSLRLEVAASRLGVFELNTNDPVSPLFVNGALTVGLVFASVLPSFLFGWP